MWQQEHFNHWFTMHNGTWSYSYRLVLVRYSIYRSIAILVNVRYRYLVVSRYFDISNIEWINDLSDDTWAIYKYRVSNEISSIVWYDSWSLEPGNGVYRPTSNALKFTPYTQTILRTWGAFSRSPMPIYAVGIAQMLSINTPTIRVHTRRYTQEYKRHYGTYLCRFVCAVRSAYYGVQSINPALHHARHKRWSRETRKVTKHRILYVFEKYVQGRNPEFRMFSREKHFGEKIRIFVKKNRIFETKIGFSKKHSGFRFPRNTS